VASSICRALVDGLPVGEVRSTEDIDLNFGFTSPDYGFNGVVLGQLGAYPAGQAAYEGYMDEVRFWSKALDPIDILAYSTKKALDSTHPDYMQLRMHFQFSSGGARFTPNDEYHEDYDYDNDFHYAVNDVSGERSLIIWTDMWSSKVGVSKYCPPRHRHAF